jgi:hypothetical protein
VRRVRTNTPLQALTTLNDQAYFEAARALAARVLREAPRSTASSAGMQPSAAAGRAAYAFRLVATRSPQVVEVERILASYQRQLDRFRKDAAAAAQTIKGCEVPDIEPAEQAAWTLVANALLNLDEALTKE